MSAKIRWGASQWIACAIVLAAALPAAAVETPPKWPEGTPAQMRDDIFGLRLRMIRELDGDKAGEKFLRESFAKDPNSGAKAYMAWACLLGQAWNMPSLTDPPRGKTLALEAIAGGSAVAMDAYGRAIAMGLVPGVEPAESIAFLQKAASAGVPRSLARLGFFHALQPNLPFGIAFAQRAAELGFPSGLVEIGDALAEGKIGGKPDLDGALNLYAEAARHADPDAWKRLKQLAENNPRAKRLLLTAQVHAANDNAWMMPGKARGRVKELEEVAGDDPLALAEVGQSYLEGYYSKRDYPKAARLLEKAAEKGSEDARFFLAKMKLRGLGVAKQPAEALLEIQRLADRRNYRAAAYFGYVYYWGVDEAPGVKKDEALAFRYVRMAAERGDVWSLTNLGFLYEHGVGTPRNYALAAKVYWQAFLRGYQPGLEKTRRLLNFVKDPPSGER